MLSTASSSTPRSPSRPSMRSTTRSSAGSPASPLGQHAVAGLLSLSSPPSPSFAFPRVRPALRSLMALALGVPALVNGAMHVVHVSWEGPEAQRPHRPVRRRGGSRAHRSRRVDPARLPLLSRLFRPPPLGHPGRRRSRVRGPRLPRRRPARPRGVRDPQAARGRRLAAVRRATPTSRSSRPTASSSRGWYRPSSIGATVLLIHGGGGDRNGARDHARMLDRHGYGVLMYDSRGRGRERGLPELLRLGLGEGRRRGDGLARRPRRPPRRGPRPLQRSRHRRSTSPRPATTSTPWSATAPPAARSRTSSGSSRSSSVSVASRRPHVRGDQGHHRGQALPRPSRT